MLANVVFLEKVMVNDLIEAISLRLIETKTVLDEIFCFSVDLGFRRETQLLIEQIMHQFYKILRRPRGDPEKKFV